MPFITCITEGIPVLDMAANTADLGKLIASAISATMTQYGLTIPELYIENISLPPAVEEALDKRTSMGLAGDLGKFTQYSAAEAMTSAAANPAGGGMAASSSVIGRMERLVLVWRRQCRQRQRGRRQCVQRQQFQQRHRFRFRRRHLPGGPQFLTAISP